MMGHDLADVLEREGFAVVRRSQSYVWLGRGEDVLLIDVDAEIEEDIAQQLITRARAKP